MDGKSDDQIIIQFDIKKKKTIVINMMMKLMQKGGGRGEFEDN